MIGWLLCLALAGPLQQVHELEWERGPAVTVANLAPGEPLAVRVAAAHALGRLRRDEALAPLDGMRADPDREVRVAVADALGWTPGSAQLLRTWLDELEPPTTVAERAAAEHGPRDQAIRALGRQGDATDLERLGGHLAEPWPASVAAAEALGRFGRRKVEGADAAVPALVEALDRVDPRTVEGAAYALRRVGLDGADAEVLSAVQRAAETTTRPQTRAWLVGALGPVLEGAARTDLFVAAATDPSPVVRVAALDALGEPDSELLDLVRPWLRATDTWVRQAAIGALGRMGARDALEAFAHQASPWDAAFAIESAGDPLGVDFEDQALPVVVRAAALSVADLEPEVRLELAREADAPQLRSAAAAGLVFADTPDASWADGLLGSRDPAVREAGLELLGAIEDPEERARALITHLRVEKEPELLGTGLEELAIVLDEVPGAIPADDRHLDSALRRAARARTARVRRAGEAVARRVGREPAEGEPTEGTRELVLPSGKVVEVARGRPVLDEVRRIRGARVTTERGRFVLALDPEIAPMAVANFAQLAESGFYEGVVFHRVVPGFVVQAGCPRGDGWGGPGWTIPDEVSGRPYATGSLGMARAGRDTGGSQWFLSTAPTPHLVGDYTWFGHVVQGMEVVRATERGDRILSVEIERVDTP